MKKILLTIGMLIALILTASIMFGIDLKPFFVDEDFSDPRYYDQEPFRKEARYTELDAYNFLKEAIKDELNDPDSAQFPSSTEKLKHTTPLGGNEFQVDSWVRSRNGFGGMVKTKFSCKVIFNNSTVSYENLRIY